jgi:hypothetical protein
MGQVSVSGSITLGPSSGGDGSFPASQDTVPLALSQPTKQAGAMTGCMSRQLNSPSSYVTLSGVGATDTVTRCDFLYIRSDAPIKVRVTQVDPAGGADIVSELNLQGPWTHEFPANGYVKLVEAKGSARIEFAFSGIS